MIDLHENTALITGSTDGVGRVVARRLGEAGVRILVHGRDSKRGNDVVAAIRGAGGRADFFMADLGSLAQVTHLAQTVIHTASRLDIPPGLHAKPVPTATSCALQSTTSPAFF